MSDFVDQIYQAMILKLEQVLITGIVDLDKKFQELAHVIDVTKNTRDGNVLGYGVLPEAFQRVAGPVGSLMVVQKFVVVLSDSYNNKDDADKEESAAVRNLFSMMDDVSKELYNTKIGLPALVEFVDHPDTDDPEYIREDNLVVLRGNFLVKYRRSVK